MASAQNKRDYQEDVAHYWPKCLITVQPPGAPAGLVAALLDGHGGTDAADFAAAELQRLLVVPAGAGPPEPPSPLVEDLDARLAGALADIDARFCAAARDRSHAGATLVLAAVHGRDLLVANIGDSRCVLCRRVALPPGRSPRRRATEEVQGLRLSRDHKPTDPDESARIKRAGGRVSKGRVGVGGCKMTLSVSRCLGDVLLKDAAGAALKDMVSGNRKRARTLVDRWGAGVAPTAPQDAAPRAPEVHRPPQQGAISVEPFICRRRLDRSDAFLVLASDGLFDVLDDDAVVQEVDRFVGGRAPGGPEPDAADEVAAAAAEHLVRKAGEKGAVDNVTAQVVLFVWPTPATLPAS